MSEGCNPASSMASFIALAAGLQPSDIAYVNAHGTSTQANEKGESQAIVNVLGKEVPDIKAS